MADRLAEPIPLFTSLPPRMSRQNGSGRNVGEEYANACLESWLACGFRPVTVNARSESLPLLYRRHEIEARKTARDASVLCGKPLPYLADLLLEMRSVSNGLVALTNADIFLRLTPQDREKVQGLKQGECVVSSRIDVDDPADISGRQYPNGFDFFVFHIEDLPDITTSNLVFGQPWWDHFLPLFLLLSGNTCIPISGDAIVHLRHTERWEKRIWSELGDNFVPSLKAALGRQTRDQYFRQAWRTHWPASVRSAPTHFLRLLTHDGLKLNSELALHRLSALNVSTIHSWNRGYA